MRAIRQKCLECSYYQPKEVRLCPITDCALYPYRHGHRPKDQDTAAENDTEKELSEE